MITARQLTMEVVVRLRHSPRAVFDSNTGCRTFCEIIMIITSNPSDYCNSWFAGSKGIILAIRLADDERSFSLFCEHLFHFFSLTSEADI